MLSPLFFISFQHVRSIFPHNAHFENSVEDIFKLCSLSLFFWLSHSRSFAVFLSFSLLLFSLFHSVDCRSYSDLVSKSSASVICQHAAFTLRVFFISFPFYSCHTFSPFLLTLVCVFVWEPRVVPSKWNKHTTRLTDQTTKRVSSTTNNHKHNQKWVSTTSTSSLFLSLHTTQSRHNSSDIITNSHRVHICQSSTLSSHTHCTNLHRVDVLLFPSSISSARVAHVCLCFQVSVSSHS